MRITHPALLAVAIGALAFGDVADAASKYDRFRDVTTVSMYPQRLYSDSLGADWTRLTIAASFECNGTSRCKPDSVRLLFYCTGLKPRFENPEDRDLHFLVGAKRLTVQISKYRSEVLAGMRSETMSAVITREAADLLFEGPTEGRLGPVEFALKSSKTFSAIEDFRSALRGPR